MKKLTSILAILVLASSCGPAAGEEEDETPPLYAYPELEAAEEPLSLADVELGVGVHHGSAISLGNQAPGEFETVTTALPNAFLWVQSYDEAAVAFGEYLVYPPPPGVDGRMRSDFSGPNAANAGLAPRAGDIFTEVEEAKAEAGDVGGFATTSLVIDFWRIRRDWWVRWDGKLDTDVNRVGQGPYGFYRSGMVDDLLDHIETAAEENQPAYLIIGDDMQRTVATDDGSGIAPAEFSNFVAFYQEAVERVRAVSPDTKIGAGINWDRFVSDIAPRFAAEGMPYTAVLDRAFRSFILPLAERGDIVALESYRDHEDTELDLAGIPITVEQAYQFLRRIGDLYEADLPIVWYSVGSPIDSPVSYNQQKLYMEAFLDWNAGSQAQLVVWRQMMNYDGSDTADQEPDGRCEAFIADNRNFEMPLSRCYDGLLTSVFSTKDVFDVFTGP